VRFTGMPAFASAVEAWGSETAGSWFTLSGIFSHLSAENASKMERYNPKGPIRGKSSKEMIS